MTSKPKTFKTDAEETAERPKCFAELDKVFPMGPDGLRHTPDFCLNCSSKTDCLRAAMRNRQGLKVYAEKVDRAYRSGVMGFLERWAKRKDIHRKMNS